MIKWGIVSDSHGNTKNLLRAAARLSGCDAIVHLGDTRTDARLLATHVPVPVHMVRGNCDGALSSAPGEMTLAVEGRKLLITHGDRYYVKLGLSRLSYRAEELGAPIALYGHTHVPDAQHVGGVLLLNPGALTLGRYMILEFRENGPVPVMKIL